MHFCLHEEVRILRRKICFFGHNALLKGNIYLHIVTMASSCRFVLEGRKQGCKALLFCLTGMAGGSRQQSSTALLLEGAGASDLLPKRLQPSGRGGAHAEPSPATSGVFPFWRGSSRGFGKAQGGEYLVPPLWTCV